MVVRRFIAAVALVLAVGTSAGAGAAEPVRCSLVDRFFARSVMAFSTVENLRYTTYTQFRGA